MNRSTLLFLFMLLLISCQRKYGNNEGKTVFRYNESNGITSLDPAFAKDLSNIWVCNQLFNGLVQLDEHLNIKPAIASHWTIDSNGTLYTFYLRQDVHFHDDRLFPSGKGRQVRANDFVYSFNRVVDPSLASPGSWVFANVRKENGKYDFKAINDSTLQIKLNKAFAPFLGILSMQYCSVVPKEIVDYYGSDFREHPVGTGPFVFKMWKEGVKLVLLKNPDYFETENGNRLPYLDAVAITFLIDKQSAFLEFVKGKLDFLSGLDPSYRDELLNKDGSLRAKYREKFNLTTEPFLNTEYLGILVDSSLDKSPFRKKAFRQALNYGFDRHKMIRYLRNNIGYPGNFGIIPPGFEAFDTNMSGYDYNPGKARQLLAKAGYPAGKNIPEITLHTVSDYLDLCKFIQHELGELGVPLKIEVNPYAALKEMKAQAKVDFFRASWIADYPDAENYLSLFYSKNFTPYGPNYMHFSNPVFDSLYLKSQGISDESLRNKLYKQMNQLVTEEAPFIILYYDEVLRFSQKNIHGLGTNPLNLLDLKRVKKINTFKN